MTSVRLVALSLIWISFGPAAAAQDRASIGAEVSGVVTTQRGTVPLAGASVVITDAAGATAAETTTAEDGGFAARVPPGHYTVTASLDGFDTSSADIAVTPAGVPTLRIDLPIAGLSQTVNVVASSPVATPEGTIAAGDGVDSQQLEQFAPTGGLQATLRLLGSVIELPGGAVSIKGGRPSQAGVQLGPGTLVDPATGLAQLSLPDDAIDAVTVLPNPYAVEYGGFSSGLVVIHTRRAGDVWKVRFNSMDPSFRTQRGSPFAVLGVGSYDPRVELGGPLVEHRLFLEQTAQFRYAAGDVPSLSQDLVRTSQSFSSFTRLDGTLSAGQSFVATAAVVPGVSHDATLGTFTPPDATIDLHTNANEVAFTERAVWNDSLLSETTLQSHDYQTNVLPQGNAPMQLLPQTTLGNFYDRLHRETGMFEAISSVSGSAQALGGQQLFKAGIDVTHSDYAMSSTMQPVVIERYDGTVARRLDFSPLASGQAVGSTDLALFAQDRYQPNGRWYTEFGLRLDRDGVLNRFNLTPRVGAAWVLDSSGASVLRGGIGLFYERTPSTAGAFAQFQAYLDTRYAADGVTPLAPSALVEPRTAADLQTARSRTWDVRYDHRVNSRWSFYVSAMDRQGSHELVVSPVTFGPTNALLLDSSGRSSYTSAEVGVDARFGTRADLHTSYSRSSAYADLNALTTYFGAVPSPVVGANQYARASSDAPNRLFARARVMPTDRWLLLGIFDWRSGLPYSVVNEYLDFAGPRNTQRFPAYVRLETGIERKISLFKFRPWVGIRVPNTLNWFLPNDVQANLSSPAFGQMYNSEYRQIRIEVRFER